MLAQAIITTGTAAATALRAVAPLAGQRLMSSSHAASHATDAAASTPSLKQWQPLTTGYFAQPRLQLSRDPPVGATSCTLGFVHSTEALSAVDGPGLRYVVVLGRPKHRPGHHIQAPSAFHGVSSILQDMQRVLVYLTPNGGGVTASGAHPLHQHRFCEDLFHGAHDLGVTTCLHSQPPPDAPSTYSALLPHTDSAIVQLNTAPLPRTLGRTLGRSGSSSAPSNSGDVTRNLLAFTGALEEQGVPYHIRYLLVPDVTDHPWDIESLAAFARSRGPQLQGIQVMPHHLVTGSKADHLGIHRCHRGFQPYSLEAALRLVHRINSLGAPATLAV